MNIDGSSDRIFNLVLAKIVGLYQILDTETVTFLGRHNVYYKMFIFLIVYQCLISVVASLNGLYYCMNNIIDDMFYSGYVINILYANYKMYLILDRSKVIWDCLSITKFDFTSYGVRGRHTLNVWRNLSIKYTNIYGIIFLIVLILYVASPIIFSNTFQTMKNDDGSTSSYRLGLLNLYLFFSEETYNTYFYVFHIFVSFGVVINVLFVIIFDTVVNTLAFGLSGQLKMISTAFESLGHKSHHLPNINIDNKMELPNENIKYMDLNNDLKKLMIDHQSILKKYDEFLLLFQPTMLLQAFVLPYSIILLWFIFLTCFVEEGITHYAVLTSVKAGFGIPFCTFQMFMSCYMFDTLHTEKDSISFALYGTNWTEMDMKFKKMILLAMRLNDAHQQKLKFTRTKIVSMEMFFQTMRVCYTIVSVMKNCKKEKLVQQ